MKHNYKKFAFTMAEMMVCLAVVSVLATILIPSMRSIRPDRSKTMFKKAYGVAEKVVYEMINNSEWYPATDIFVGFDNTKVVTINGVEYGTLQEPEIVYPEGATEEQKEELRAQARAEVDEKAKRKFCQLFATEVNKISAVSCKSHNAPAAGGAFEPSFVTSDGVWWLMPHSDFAPYQNYQSIWIDVNGSEKPNVIDIAGPASECPDNSTADIFEIQVRADGKMRANGRCAQRYMNDMNLMRNRM